MWWGGIVSALFSLSLSLVFHSCRNRRLYSRASWQLRSEKRALLIYLSKSIFQVFLPRITSHLLRHSCSRVGSEADTQPLLCQSKFFSQPTSNRCVLYIGEIFWLDDGSGRPHTGRCTPGLSPKAAACIQARESSRRQSDRQKHSHVTPLTLCAVFSGWVMSHCSPLSLMQRAVGRSLWPHSATFTSPIRMWSHTSHFAFSLLQAIINLLNQSLLNFSSPEIRNGRQIRWAATSSYENETSLCHGPRMCVEWVKCRLKHTAGGGYLHNVSAIIISVRRFSLCPAWRWLRDHSRPVAPSTPSAKLFRLSAEDYETGFKIERTGSPGLWMIWG